MLRLLIVLAVIAAALIRGGSLRNLADLRMRHMSLVLAAFALQLLIFPLVAPPSFRSPPCRSTCSP